MGRIFLSSVTLLALWSPVTNASDQVPIPEAYRGSYAFAKDTCGELFLHVYAYMFEYGSTLCHPESVDSKGHFTFECEKHSKPLRLLEDGTWKLSETNGTTYLTISGLEGDLRFRRCYGEPVP